MTERGRKTPSAARSLLAKLALHNSSIALVDQLVASATTFATGVIVARACTQEDLGLYQLGFSIVMATMILQSSLILSPYTVFSPRFHDHRHRTYSGSNLVLQVALSVTAMAGLAVFSASLFCATDSTGLAVLAAVLAGVISFLLLREFARRISFANLNFIRALWIDCSVCLLQVGLLLLLWRIGRVTPTSAFAVAGLVTAVTGFTWLFRSRDDFSISVDCIRDDAQHNWSIGKWLFASAVTWESNVIVYPWILAAIHGTATTGVWAACFGVVSLANPLLLGMQNSVGPQMAHAYAGGGIKRLRVTLRRTIAVYSVVVAPVCFALILVGGWLIVFIYGEDYTGHGLVVIPLAFDILVNPTRVSLSRALVVLERSDVDFLTNLFSPVVLILLGFWLAKAFGPLGVACGILFGSLIVTFAKFVVFSRVSRMLD